MRSRRSAKSVSDESSRCFFFCPLFSATAVGVDVVPGAGAGFAIDAGRSAFAARAAGRQPGAEEPSQRSTDVQLWIPKVSSMRPSYVSIVSIGVTQSVLRSRKMAESIDGDSSRRASLGSGSVSRRTDIWFTSRCRGKYKVRSIIRKWRLGLGESLEATSNVPVRHHPYRRDAAQCPSSAAADASPAPRSRRMTRHRPDEGRSLAESQCSTVDPELSNTGRTQKISLAASRSSRLRTSFSSGIQRSGYSTSCTSPRTPSSSRILRQSAVARGTRMRL